MKRDHAWDLLDVLVGGDVGAGDLLHHLLSHSPQGKTPVPGPGDQELVIQPGLVKDPVVVGILTDADRVKGGQPVKLNSRKSPLKAVFFFFFALPVNCHIIAVSGSSSEQRAGGVDLDAVDPALLVRRHRVL